MSRSPRDLFANALEPGRPASPRPQGLEVQLDQTSGLPVLASVVHDLYVLLEANGYLGLILVDLRPMSRIETEHGSTLYNQTIAELADLLESIRQDVLRKGDLICMSEPYGEQLLLFLERPREPHLLKGEELEKVVDRVWMALAPRVTELTSRVGLSESLRLGYSLVLPNKMVQPERLIYRAVDEARAMAQLHSRRIAARARERLRDLLVNRELRMVFQPIVRLKDLGISGYEALVRGPPDSQLVSPATLFGLATQANLVGELAQACFELSLEEVVSMPKGSMLFANVWPSLLNDSSFRSTLLRYAVGGLAPGRLVIELFEGAAVHNYKMLNDNLLELRKAGVLLAIDDLGAGYSNLDHVLRLQPDFLKLDISLISQLESSCAKQAMVSSMVSIGRALGATVIAEGVETSAEYAEVERLEVPWAQGFHFARPAPGFARLNRIFRKR